jgi:hypothetical protein
MSSSTEITSPQSAFEASRSAPAQDTSNALVTFSNTAQASGDQTASETLASRPQGPVAADLRRALIAEAAYFMAEHRGFEPGHEIEDWLCAESRIDAAIAYGKLPVPDGSAAPK